MIFNSPQKWNDNNDNELENSNNYNPNITINFNRNKKRIDISNKIDSNKSVELKNKLNKYKYLNENRNQNKKINDDEKDKISINFDELKIFEEIINDISKALTRSNTLEEKYLNNKSLEFFKFYLNSSLYNKFSGFFSEENFIIIQSSINLLLFIIMLIYYLFNNSEKSNQYISILITIFNKFTINIYLIIRQIELYYNNNSRLFDLNENKTNFNKIINKFKNSNIYNIKDLNEEDIILEINDNCTNISNNIHRLLNKYFDYVKNTNNNEKNYYNEFLNIFNQISLITESDITNLFYNNIKKKYNNNNDDKKLSKMSNIFLDYKNFNSSIKNRRTIKQNKTNINYSNYKNINSFTKDIISNTDLNELDFNPEEKNIKNKFISIYRINEQNKNNNILNINKSIDDNYFQNSKLIPPFIRNEKPNNKRYTLILDLDETLVHVGRINQQIINNYNYNINEQIVINLRPGLFSFLNSIKPYYEIISFSTASKNYADNIVKKIETNRKYFDYNLYRDHTTLYGKEYVKDISKIGRNIKEIIIVDNLEKNFKLNPDNGIKIAPYFGEINADDTKLFELQKLLILFFKLKYDDLRMAIKEYKQYIKNKISI
jgi:Dullard-like phosphatase family protein